MVELINRDLQLAGMESSMCFALPSQVIDFIPLYVVPLLERPNGRVLHVVEAYAPWDQIQEVNFKDQETTLKGKYEDFTVCVRL